jgi:hypothetical protein
MYEAVNRKTKALTMTFCGADQSNNQIGMSLCAIPHIPDRIQNVYLGNWFNIITFAQRYLKVMTKFYSIRRTLFKLPGEHTANGLIVNASIYSNCAGLQAGILQGRQEIQ